MQFVQAEGLSTSKAWQAVIPWHTPQLLVVLTPRSMQQASLEHRGWKGRRGPRQPLLLSQGPAPGGRASPKP